MATRLAGRKDLNLGGEMALSLVSWMQATVGWQVFRVSRTAIHLSSSPRSRTFQDTMVNLRFELISTPGELQQSETEESTSQRGCNSNRKHERKE
jgi:hypothetical protein